MECHFATTIQFWKDSLKNKGTIPISNEVHVSVFLFFRHPVLAGDQWWPRTIGGRLRFARAITYLLHNRFSNLIKGNKRNSYEKDW